VAMGLVASLARPGGNVTGLTFQAPGLSGKRLELLKEAAPQTTLVAVLWNAANPSHVSFLRETEAAARWVSSCTPSRCAARPSSTGRLRP
jgi:putative ABC transport system substrate-binding protein